MPQPKIVTKWFSDRPNIQLIKWLGQSSDLNLLVWAWMKLKMHDYTAKNLDECWKDFTAVDNIQYLKYLMESMLRRIQEIDREGWTSKYQDMSSAYVHS